MQSSYEIHRENFPLGRVNCHLFYLFQGEFCPDILVREDNNIRTSFLLCDCCLSTLVDTLVGEENFKTSVFQVEGTIFVFTWNTSHCNAEPEVVCDMSQQDFIVAVLVDNDILDTYLTNLLRNILYSHRDVETIGFLTGDSDTIEAIHQKLSLTKKVVAALDEIKDLGLERFHRYIVEKIIKESLFNYPWYSSDWTCHRLEANPVDFMEFIRNIRGSAGGYPDEIIERKVVDILEHFLREIHGFPLTVP